MAPASAIDKICEDLKLFGDFQEEYAFSTIDGLDEKYIAEQMSNMGFDYYKG